MKRLAFAILALSLAALPACPGNQQQQEAKIETENEKISYSLGVDIGRSLSQGPADVNYDLVARGLHDAASGAELAMSTEDMRAALQTLQQKMQAEQQKRMQEQMKEMQAQMEETMAAGKTFMEKNAQREGVQTLEDGLQLEILETGEGPKPDAEDVVEIHYRGELVNGTVFDSSYRRDKPATFPLKGVIPGFSEGLQHIRKGGKAKLVIPPELAYQDKQAGPNIPPGSTLIFEVEMLDVKDQQEAQGQSTPQ
jgi:FKBP-type peptidyl-prolyl cis-trans isomerase